MFHFGKLCCVANGSKKLHWLFFPSFWVMINKIKLCSSLPHLRINVFCNVDRRCDIVVIFRTPRIDTVFFVRCLDVSERSNRQLLLVRNTGNSHCLRNMFESHTGFEKMKGHTVLGCGVLIHKKNPRTLPSCLEAIIWIDFKLYMKNEVGIQNGLPVRPFNQSRIDHI